MNNILVTGFRGFIGSTLFRTLRNQNLSVIGLDSNYLAKIDWEDELKQFLNLHNPKTIFHVGACTNTLIEDVNYAFIRNFQATKILVDWSVINNSNFIFSSSAACYGTNLKSPSNIYGWSKYCAENYVNQKGGISLRYFNVYGPGEYSKGKMASMIFQALELAKSNTVVKLFPGNPTRDFIFIDDIVNANIHALREFNKIDKGKYYEVGTGVSNSFEHILQVLKIRYIYLTEFDIPKGYQFHTKSDSNKWLPNWKSEISLIKGLEIYQKNVER